MLIFLGITGAAAKYMASSSPEDNDYDDYYPSSSYSSYHRDRDEESTAELLERIRNSHVTTPPIYIPEIPRTNVADFDIDSITRRFNTYFPETRTQSTSPVSTGSNPRLYTFSRRTGRLQVDD